MRDVILCLRGTDFCHYHHFRGTIWGKLRKKYENKQKVWRKRENTNSHKIIDLLHFTDLYFLFICFYFLGITCRCKSFEIYFAMFLPRLYLLLQQSHLVRGYIVLNPHLPNLLIIPIAILPVLYE